MRVRRPGPREFIFVPDIAWPILELSLRTEAYGERWNLAGAGSRTPMELLQLGADFCDRAVRVRRANRALLFLLGLMNAEVREIRELYTLCMNPPILNMSKLEQLIGPIPVTSYEDGIRETLDWIRKDL